MGTCADAEHRDGLHQLLCLRAQALGGGGGLLHQRGVLLRHLVELRHRVVDLADARGLLGGGRGDLVDQVADALHLLHDVGHRAAGLADQLRAGVDLLDAGADERLREDEVRRLFEAEALVGRAEARIRKAPSKGRKDRDLQALEEELSDQLGTAVFVTASRSGRGKLVINYSSLDQLDEFLLKLRS